MRYWGKILNPKTKRTKKIEKGEQWKEIRGVETFNSVKGDAIVTQMFYETKALAF